LLVAAALVTSGLVAALPAVASPSSTAQRGSVAHLDGTRGGGGGGASGDGARAGGAHGGGPYRGGAHGRGDYLALGDSVAFGYRPPAVTPPADYLDAANFVGYPEDLAKLTGLRLANASCPGETTASMITRGVPSNGCENSPGPGPGYRSTYPLHVSYTGTQLEYAVEYLRSHPRTRLVSIDIGANDVFLCQATTTDGCAAKLPATLAQIGANLATILSALRDQAHYEGPLVLLTYYSLNYTDPVQVAGTQELNRLLAATAKPFGVTVADGFTAFKLASARAGGDPCAAGLLIPLPAGGCNIHPTARGHWVLTAAVAQAVVRNGVLKGARG
jgi:lysophospholipase L1-like esterase